MKKLIIVLICFISISIICSNKQMDSFSIKSKTYKESNNNELVPNTIYIKDKYVNEYVRSNNYTVDIGDVVQLKAVLETPLNMNGNVPSEQYYQGSGFWSWDVTLTNVWTQINNNKWLVECSIQTDRAGTFTVGLGKNGNGEIASIAVNVYQNLIEIEDVKVGTQEYHHLNKNLVTRMFNGKNYGSNSAENRYVIYVGDTITLNAENDGEYIFEATNIDSIRYKKESSYSNGKSSITITATNPGYNEILLKDQNQNVTEIFFILVRYPIYVETSNGEMHKDFVHEYLETALTGMYEANPEKTITNPESVPQYVKNEWDYYMLYYLFGDMTVDLVTYVSPEDNTDFAIVGNLEMSNHKSEIVESGDKAGFKRISATFKITSEGGSASVGYDNFIMSLKSSDTKVHHFDLETNDGGQAIKIETYNHLNGNKEVIETYYHASIYSIHGSTIYSKMGTLLEIPKNEYWETLTVDNTQYESTSAYITDENGHLIDQNGNIIDEEVRNGTKEPRLKQRNINIVDVDKVSFVADLNLQPYKVITKSYKKNSNGIDELVDTKEEKLLNAQLTQYKNYEIVMNHKEIVDAYNKCPYHSGLDFTIKLLVYKEETIDDIINPDTLNNVLVILLVIISLISILCLSKRKKRTN